MYEIKSKRNSTSTLFRLCHDMNTMKLFLENCARNSNASVSDRCMCFKYGSGQKQKKNEKYVHSKIDIAPDESGFWIRHIECGSQRASQHCDLLTKYFINFWTFWIWLLLLCTRGDGKQRRHSHGTGGLVWSVVGHGRCSQLTLLQWIHPSCTQTLWADEWTKSTTKTFFFPRQNDMRDVESVTHVTFAWQLNWVFFSLLLRPTQMALGDGMRWENSVCGELFVVTALTPAL